jgi:high frequency lysogenization protein
MADPIMKDRVTALAAVFQAAVLVEDIANNGHTSSRAFSTSVNSLFALDADTVQGIFPDATGLATGRDFLAAVLRRDGGAGSTNRVSYVMAMLHLTSVMRGNPAMQEVIRSRLVQIAESTRSLEDRSTDDVIAKVAALYVDTFGGLRFRVQVKGDPKQLQVPEVAARIRACLFAGVRAAHLWHHLGGRRWQLLLGTGKMLDAL